MAPRHLKEYDWRVRYAAAIALGDRKSPKAVDALLEALNKEEKEPLFSQPALEGGHMPVQTSPAVLEVLHRYATDQKCDYALRAAACQALGQISSPESLPVLEKAANDEEWCTSCEAKKAVSKIKVPISRTCDRSRNTSSSDLCP